MHVGISNLSEQKLKIKLCLECCVRFTNSQTHRRYQIERNYYENRIEDEIDSICSVDDLI